MKVNGKDQQTDTVTVLSTNAKGNYISDVGICKVRKHTDVLYIGLIKIDGFTDRWITFGAYYRHYYKLNLLPDNNNVTTNSLTTN
jgi:hypothetical protein